MSSTSVEMPQPNEPVDTPEAERTREDATVPQGVCTNYATVENSWLEAMRATLQGSDTDKVWQMGQILNEAGKVRGCRSYFNYVHAFGFVTEAEIFMRANEF